MKYTNKGHKVTEPIFFIKPKCLNLFEAEKWMTNLQKYIALYGLRFSQEDHIWFIKVLYGLLVAVNVDPVRVEKFGKLLISLVKKKYLVASANLILDWKPLYKLIYKYKN